MILYTIITITYATKGKKRVTKSLYRRTYNNYYTKNINQ